MSLGIFKKLIFLTTTVVLTFFLTVTILIAGIVGSFDTRGLSKGEAFNERYVGVFPIPVQFSYRYSNDFGAPRRYGGKRIHLGIDIFAKEGTPIAAVKDGVVERIGWNQLGGWRVGIRGKDGNYYYYAHLSGYSKGLNLNQHITQGSIIGYMGATGYGPIGTTGKFAPHLHFGIYDSKGVPINPYYLLKDWENSQKGG